VSSWRNAMVIPFSPPHRTARPRGTKSFNPATGQLLSAHQLAIGQQDTVEVVGASNGLLYMQIGTQKWADGILYSNYRFAAYRLSDGSLAWGHTMPSFPPPTSANTNPNTSRPVLAP
jgi:hypothetical protein